MINKQKIRTLKYTLQWINISIPSCPFRVDIDRDYLSMYGQMAKPIIRHIKETSNYK